MMPQGRVLLNAITDVFQSFFVADDVVVELGLPGELGERVFLA